MELTPKLIEEELGEKEGEFIRELKPVLNTQIPKADNWRNVWLATPTPDARPVLLNLQPGTHTLTLTNTDGLGLNLDWLRLVPCRNR